MLKWFTYPYIIPNKIIYGIIGIFYLSLMIWIATGDFIFVIINSLFLISIGLLYIFYPNIIPKEKLLYPDKSMGNAFNLVCKLGGIAFIITAILLILVQRVDSFSDLGLLLLPYFISTFCSYLVLYRKYSNSESVIAKSYTKFGIALLIFCINFYSLTYFLGQ